MASQAPVRDHARRGEAASALVLAGAEPWMAWDDGWKESSIGCWTTATIGRSPGRRRSGRRPGAARPLSAGSGGSPRPAMLARRTPRRSDVPGHPWRRSPAVAPPPPSGLATNLPRPPPARRPPGPNPRGAKRGGRPQAPAPARTPPPARTGRRKTASRSPAGDGRTLLRPSPSIRSPPPRPRLPRRDVPCRVPPGVAERDTFNSVGLCPPSP